VVGEDAARGRRADHHWWTRQFEKEKLYKWRVVKVVLVNEREDTEVLPYGCPAAADEGCHLGCTIEKRGSIVCRGLDLSGPLKVEFTQYHCSNHHKTFPVLGPRRFPIPQGARLSEKVYRTRTMVLSEDFMSYIVSVTLERKSIMEVTRAAEIVTACWRTGDKLDNWPGVTVPTVTRKIVKTILLALVAPFHVVLQQIIAQNCKQEVTSISLDHTFKICKQVGSYIEGNWRNSKYTALGMLDQQGRILCWSMGRNLGGDFVKMQLIQVLSNLRAKEKLQVISTDRIFSDRLMIRDALAASGIDVAGVSLCEDLFHFVHRRFYAAVRKSHKDYRLFRQRMGQWVAKLKNGKFSTTDELRASLNEIKDEFQYSKSRASTVGDFCQFLSEMTDMGLAETASSTTGLVGDAQVHEAMYILSLGEGGGSDEEGEAGLQDSTRESAPQAENICPNAPSNTTSPAISRPVKDGICATSQVLSAFSNNTRAVVLEGILTYSLLKDEIKNGTVRCGSNLNEAFHYFLLPNAGNRRISELVGFIFFLAAAIRWSVTRGHAIIDFSVFAAQIPQYMNSELPEDERDQQDGLWSSSSLASAVAHSSSDGEAEEDDEDDVETALLEKGWSAADRHLLVAALREKLGRLKDDELQFAPTDLLKRKEWKNSVWQSIATEDFHNKKTPKQIVEGYVALHETYLS
jgi:hypothetical protein